MDIETAVPGNNDTTTPEYGSETGAASEVKVAGCSPLSFAIFFSTCSEVVARCGTFKDVAKVVLIGSGWSKGALS